MDKRWSTKTEERRMRHGMQQPALPVHAHGHPCTVTLADGQNPHILKSICFPSMAYVYVYRDIRVHIHGSTILSTTVLLSTTFFYLSIYYFFIAYAVRY